MKRKRMIKLLMGLGASRNAAVWAANQCDGNLSHGHCLGFLLDEYIRYRLRQQRRSIIEGDMTGEVAGMVGSAHE